jgi:hypothetical protein
MPRGRFAELNSEVDRGGVPPAAAVPDQKESGHREKRDEADAVERG